MKKALNFLTVLACSALCICPLSSDAAKFVFRGDITGDGVVSTSDINLLRNHLKGVKPLKASQYTAADVNGDKVVDIFDLAAMRKISARSLRGTLPRGTWLASGNEGVKYYYFDNKGSGNYIAEKDGKGYGFTSTISQNQISFLIGSAKTQNNAVISWMDDKHCMLRWSSGNIEKLTYYSNNRIAYQSLPSGRWVTSGGYGNRVFNFTGVHGNYVNRSGIKGTCLYGINGSDFTMEFNDSGNVFHAKYTKIDPWHFKLEWETGAVETFTKQEFSTKNGITYVNGVLIANKSYGLTSSYDPGGLTAETNSAFKKMQSAAYADGINLWICSGYRSYSYQSQLYNSYAARDGYAKADTYSARPGHSEHQTGLAMDINIAGDAFNNTPEAKWLAANCWKYGFIIRYPKGKQDITGYKYESWHCRYLGNELAKNVYNSGLTLEEYLCIDSYYH